MTDALRPMQHLTLPVHRAATIDIALHRDFLELRFEDRCVATISRDVLRTWLSSPTRRRPYSVDDITWLPTAGAHVRLTILHAGTWTLHPGTVRQLLAQL